MRAFSPLLACLVYTLPASASPVRTDMAVSVTEWMYDGAPGREEMSPCPAPGPLFLYLSPLTPPDHVLSLPEAGPAIPDGWFGPVDETVGFSSTNLDREADPEAVWELPEAPISAPLGVGLVLLSLLSRSLQHGSKRRMANGGIGASSRAAGLSNSCSQTPESPYIHTIPT